MRKFTHTCIQVRHCIALIPQITTIALFFLLHGNASNAQSSPQFTISVKNVPVVKVFTIIEQQSSYRVMYSAQLLKDAKRVSMEVKDAPLEKVLEHCFKEQPFGYRIVGTDIMVVAEKPALKENLRLPSLPGMTNDTVITVSGSVIAAGTGSPLAGVTVVEKGTRNGVTTNERGEFTVHNVSRVSTLAFSSIGYKSVEVGLNGRASYLNVKLPEFTSELDRVIVQGYGTTTQRYSTGNIVTVTAKEIERQPVMNVLTALQGKVPGLIISQQNGYASAPFKVEIRGRKLLNDKVAPDPLIIIDGVPLTTLDLNGASPEGSPGFIVNQMVGPAGGQSPLFSLNPADIESVTVLKDADATAIYGSRGGSGVIIINTKKGKIGKTVLDANVYAGFSRVPRYYNMMNTTEYLAMRREALKNDGITPDAGSAPDLVLWDTTRNVNWQKILWGGTGKTQDAQISLSGGSGTSTFRISAGYHKETGITAVSGNNQRASIQFNLTHKSLNQKLTILYTNFYSYAQVNETGYDANQASLPPNAPAIYDSVGNLNFAGYRPTSLFGFASLKQPYLSKTNFLNNHLAVKYEIVKGLSVSSSFGYGNNRIGQTFLLPIASKDPLTNPKGSAFFGNNNSDRWIIEPQVDFVKYINALKITAVAGATHQKVNTSGTNISGQGYVDDNLINSVSNAPIKSAGDISGQYKYSAIFGRVNFNILEKYIINISGRRDGSSRFGSGKQYGNFGSVGLGWIFSQEPLIKKLLPVLSFGKLRASYGITGSDNIGDYQFITRWTGNTNLIDPYLGQAVYGPIQHANPNLQWQANKKLEVGLNVGFLKDKLSFELNWYRDRCENQLIDYMLPALTGFESVSANSPAKVENSGYEAIIRTTPIETKSWSLSLNFNIGINRNKLLAFPNIEQSSYSNLYFVGQPLNIGRVFRYTGIDHETGLYTFEDKNKDGRITQTGTDNDLFFKNTNSKYDGGIGFDFSCHNFQFNAFFTFQRKPFLRSAIYSSTFPGLFGQGNQPMEVTNHWSKPGDNARFARYTTQGDITDSYFLRSTGVFSDGSSIRLQNLSMSYDFASLISKRKLASVAKIFVRGENLLLLTNYEGIDPAIPSFGSLPLQRIITGGFQVTF